MWPVESLATCGPSCHSPDPGCWFSTAIGLAPPASAVKVAVTERLADSVTVHGPAPVQALLQPAKVEPAAAVALRATAVPLA